MPTVTNSPQETTQLIAEARKSFSLGLHLRYPNGAAVDLTQSAVSFTAGKLDRAGNTVVLIDRDGDIEDPESGYVRINLQASELDLRPNSYMYTVTLIHVGYSLVLLRGELKVEQNTEFDSVNQGYSGGSPPTTLMLYLRQDHTVHVELSTGIPAGDLLLPGRLSIPGQEIQDWNAAEEVGFYWSDGFALNEPVPGRPGQGVVTAGLDGQIEQVVTVLTEIEI